MITLYAKRAEDGCIVHWYDHPVTGAEKFTENDLMKRFHLDVEGLHLIANSRASLVDFFNGEYAADLSKQARLYRKLYSAYEQVNL